MEWKNIYRGFVMGTSDLVPGVSGGTIAVILGFYDQLITAINGLFSPEWKKHLRFLLPLGVGMALAIFSLTHVMKWLLANYMEPTYFFFIGLIIGILPYLFRESNAKEAFRWYHVLLLVFGAVIISQLPVNLDEGAIIAERTFTIYLLLFFSGFIASTAMILPGISGSLVLLVIGVYSTVLHAISMFDLQVILVVGIGIAIGIVTMSKLIHYFLNNYRTATFALIIGFVIGSVFVIYNGFGPSLLQMIMSIIVFGVGLFTAYVLGKVEY